MKHTRILSWLLILALVVGTFAGCGNKQVETTETTEATPPVAESAGTVTVSFWTAPEQYNLDIWTKYADQFNATNTQVEGKTIKVEVQQMPAQPSSEAGIQNAIATGTIPVASENINRSFAATLADSQAVYDLNSADWFNEIVKERAMESVMEGWQVDGAQYVLPLYVNPVSYYWNSKALADLGITAVPQTMADFQAVLTAYADKKDDLKAEGVTHFMYRHELIRPDGWWERWFDMEAQYNAFSAGKSLVEGETLTMDKTAMTKVFELYGAMGNSLLTGEIPNIWQEETVPVVMGMGLPWDIQPNQAAGKEYGLDADYVFGPMLVEKAGDTPYTFADSKGIVLYKHESISQEQHDGMIAFLSYVFTGEGKETFDIDWLDTTTMLPVRGDLDTNPILADYFSANPALKDVAAFVANGIPCMDHPKMAEILTAMAEDGITPYITEKVETAEINNAPAAEEYIDKMIDSMKSEGGLS